MSRRRRFQRLALPLLALLLAVVVVQQLRGLRFHRDGPHRAERVDRPHDHHRSPPDWHHEVHVEVDVR